MSEVIFHQFFPRDSSVAGQTQIRMNSAQTYPIDWLKSIPPIAVLMLNSAADFPGMFVTVSQRAAPVFVALLLSVGFTRRSRCPTWAVEEITADPGPWTSAVCLCMSRHLLSFLALYHSMSAFISCLFILWCFTCADPPEPYRDVLYCSHVRSLIDDSHTCVIWFVGL